LNQAIQEFKRKKNWDSNCITKRSYEQKRANVLCIVDISFLKEKFLKLEKSLKHDNLLDIDGFDLISELNILREIIGLKNDKPIDILNYIKRMNYFPNTYITYRIILTILM